jgi:hypothetical protein
MDRDVEDLILVLGAEDRSEFTENPGLIRERWTLRKWVVEFPRPPAGSEVSGRQIGPIIDTGRLPWGADTLPDALAGYAEGITHLRVAHCERSEIRFAASLAHLRDVDIWTGGIRDLRPLLNSRGLASLALQYNRGNLAILSSWPHLRDVFLEYWAPGAESLGECLELQYLHVGGWPMEDLGILINLDSLQRVSIGFGKMRTLNGIPKGIREIDLSSCHRLEDISALRDLSGLEKLIVTGARSLKDVTGLEGARELQVLSMGECGPLKSLEPVSGIDTLRYVWLAQGAVDGETGSVDALYGKRKLETLFISRKSGLRPEIVLESSPNCDVRLVR